MGAGARLRGAGASGEVSAFPAVGRAPAVVMGSPPRHVPLLHHTAMPAASPWPPWQPASGTGRTQV